MSDAQIDLQTLRSGRKRDLASALSSIEHDAWRPETVSLLDEARLSPLGRTFGLTGPPGVGKSTLIDALTRHFVGQGLSVAILAVDPSSARTGGALLGDRTRFSVHDGSDRIFFRSLAAQGHLGGLSSRIFPCMVLMRALFDRVLIETVGVGQSEADIVGVADSIVLCIQPGSGDSLQFMKAGIMEIPDVAVVTKADLGAPAERALSELKGALSLSPRSDGWNVPALKISSTTEANFSELDTAFETHWQHLRAGRGATLEERRDRQMRDWVLGEIERGYGKAGRRLVERDWGIVAGKGAEAITFSSLQQARERLHVSLASPT